MTQDPRVGQTFAGRYRIVARVGCGGMGCVYKAIDEHLFREVALKLLSETYSQNTTIVQRFLQEARIAAKLEHDNIIDILDIGVQNNDVYYVMKLLLGDDLETEIKNRNRFSWKDAEPLVLQIIAALSAAHQMGVVHRDIKPGNCFLTELRDGTFRLKVLDFGIAKVIGGVPLTDNPTVMGSAEYMAPEQARAQSVDRRTDVYAVAGVLYCMLVGHPPYPADNPLAAITRMLQEPLIEPRIAAPDANIPEKVNSAIVKGLAKDPKMRFQSVEEFGAALVDAATEISKHESASPILKIAGASIKTVFLNIGVVVIGLVAYHFLISKPSITSAEATPQPISDTGSIILDKSADNPDDEKEMDINSDNATKAGPDVGVAEVDLEVETNPWILVQPVEPSIVLGVFSDQVSPSHTGFRPHEKRESPKGAYSIQQHEVTWAELSDWFLSANYSGSAPSFPDVSKDGNKPATNVPWEMANQYCRSLGADSHLPSEEQWEYAARGPDRLPYPWGGDDPTKMEVWAYRGANATVHEVMTAQDDVTSDSTNGKIYDLAGNALEWTSAEIRGGHIVRGLPLTEDVPTVPGSRKKSERGWPREGAAFRVPVCPNGSETCVAYSKLAPELGFRCAKEEPDSQGVRAPNVVDWGYKLTKEESCIGAWLVSSGRSSWNVTFEGYNQKICGKFGDIEAAKCFRSSVGQNVTLQFYHSDILYDIVLKCDEGKAMWFEDGTLYENLTLTRKDK